MQDLTEDLVQLQTTISDVLLTGVRGQQDTNDCCCPLSFYSKTDNPFFEVGSEIGGEIGENVQMTFAYGIRNSFGMDVDPSTGNVWISENGEDAYDELNLVKPGFNSGWIQIMGPAEDVADYKEI